MTCKLENGAFFYLVIFFTLSFLTPLSHLFAFTVTLTDPHYHKPLASDVRVFGLSQKDALSFDGDPKGVACSYGHRGNDISNRWCHALVAKVAGAYLTKSGLSDFTGAILSGLTFLPKEYLYDKNASLADIVATEIPLYLSRDRGQKLGLTIFGDGASFLSFSRDF